MGTERPHRLERINQLSNLSDIYIEVDYPAWPRTCALSLEILNNTLQVKANEKYIDEKLKDQNVTSVEFINQNTDPSLPPNTFPVNNKTHIAINENFIYVWVPISNKWKRIPLSDW